MSVTVKKIGCANLKAIIEEDKLLFNDFQIFQELTTFVQKKQAGKQTRDTMMTS